MPAVVHTAPYLDRSARLVCLDCEIEEPFERTEPAQAAAREHNARHHPLTTEPKET